MRANSKVFYVFYTFDNGHQIELFSTKAKAKAFAHQLAAEYATEYGEKSVRLADIPDLTDGRCNVEIGAADVK